MSFNVEVLEQSFSRIKPYSNQFAFKFYQNLFADYPQVRPLFANTDMEVQEKKLMQTLLLILLNLRYPDVWAKFLKDLGERHVHYATVQEHYPMVGATLLKTLEFYLGVEWTLEVKQAWTDAYGEIVNLMLAGASQAKEIPQLKQTQQPSALSSIIQAPAPDSVTTHPLKLKLFPIIYLVASLLALSFLFYYSSLRQDNNSLELNQINRN